MTYMYGKDETVTCLVDVRVKGGKDEALCLAYKTSSYSFFAPLYFRDDGYVLGVKEGLHTYYPVPSGAEVAALQASGDLPNPFPAYAIPLADYVLGSSLWIILAAIILIGIVKNSLKERRKALLETALPPGATRLVIRTKTDRWLADEAGKLLEGGETVEQQAYGRESEESSAFGKAFYVVLTNRRLLVIHVRIGLFRPLRENRGVTTHDRSAVARAESDERHVRFVMKDSSTLDFFADWSERHLSNQRRFLSDAPRLFAAAAPFAVNDNSASGPIEPPVQVKNSPELFMFCTQCGKGNPDQAKFCFSCGSPLQIPAVSAVVAPVVLSPVPESLEVAKSQTWPAVEESPATAASPRARGSRLLRVVLGSVILIAAISGVAWWLSPPAATAPAFASAKSILERLEKAAEGTFKKPEQKQAVDAPQPPKSGSSPSGWLPASADREASDFVQSRINNCWIKGPDGWTTRLVNHNRDGQVIPGEPPVDGNRQNFFKQYHELNFSIQPETITDTQRLNGVEYLAQVQFEIPSVRYYGKKRVVRHEEIGVFQDVDGPKGWSPWADDLEATLPLEVERRNGTWQFANTWAEHWLFEGLKPDPASVPAGK